MQTRQDVPSAIFLSPHFDDIALSCGAMAARLSRMGARCIGLTIFAAPPQEGQQLSPFAQGLHSKWDASGTGGDAGSGSATNEMRRNEERHAMRTLGLEPVWLNLPDAPYRHDAVGRHFYTSNSELFGKVAPEEIDMLVPHVAHEISRVAREHSMRGKVRVFAPLAVGHHVDHQIVFRASRRLGPRFGVLYYEDYPYSGKEGALASRLRELSVPLQPRVTPVPDLIGVKIAAINRYKSQLDVLFGSAEEMPKQVRAYMQSIGGAPDLYAERFWYIPSVYTLV